MAVIYGVLRATVDRFKREDVAPGSTKSPHLQIRVVDDQSHVFRIPVNVRSGDPEKSLVIFHRADPLLSHPIVASLNDIPSGLTDLNHQSRSASNALDYLRAPLFDFPTGIALPPTAPGTDDDLQDVVSRQLTELKLRNGELFAFGSHFHDAQIRPGIDAEFGTRDGMHDIHMNQGNGQDHAADNGVFNDGGLILRFPDRVTGLFFRFKTQFLPTDDVHGNRIPGVSREIPPAGTLPGVPAPAPPSPVPPAPAPPTQPNPVFPDVYIERALLNPPGADPGMETVVLGNTTMNAVDLTGWSIVDRNNAAEKLRNVMLPPGASVSVVLTGKSAQLSNNGGTIRLVNPQGILMHAVSYAKADAVEARYIRFNT